MESPSIPAAWSALFLGLFAIASAVGELRKPGMWRRMMGELETSPALQITLGLIELASGVLSYAAIGPWDGGDWLAVVTKVLATLMVLEARSPTAGYISGCDGWVPTGAAGRSSPCCSACG